MTDIYWANEPTKDLPGFINNKVHEFYEALEATGRIEMWRRSARTHFGLDADGGWAHSSAVTYGGEAGELPMIRANHYRSLIRQILVMTTGERPSFQARALRADPKALKQTELAQRLLEYFMTEKRLEELAVECAETCLVYGEGWYALTWDAAKGEQYGVREVPIMNDDGSPKMDDEGNPKIEEMVVYEGDISSEVLIPINVIRDPRQHIGDMDWVIVRREVNRWDLIAEYPDYEEQIRNADKPRDAVSLFDYWSSLRQARTQDDYVYYFEFYHERTPAVPNGRHALIIGDTVLYDVPLPYERVPVFPMYDSTELQTGYGYSNVWDLLGPQAALDSVYTTALANHDAFGVQNIIAPKGSDVEAEDLGGGLRMIEFDPALGPPAPLDLLRIDSSTFQLASVFTELMETLSGVNSVARGNPESSLKSGTALALVHSMALKFNNGFQRAYIRLLENIGTHTLDLLKAFAATPRLAEVSGPGMRTELVQFNRESLQNVKRVVIELGSPLMRTTSGKAEIARELLDKGLIKNPDDYFMVLTTGRLEPAYKTQKAARMNILQENEMISQGQKPIVMPTDNHQEHIMEHRAELDNPEARKDQAIRQAAEEHIADHFELLMTMSMKQPGLLLATGQQPLPPPPDLMGLMGPPPEGGAPPPGEEGPVPPPPPEGNQRAEVPGAPGQVTIPGHEQAVAAMPTMPTDPSTGQPVAPGGE